MAVNKVEVDGEVLIDLTNDNVTPETMARGTTAHDKTGAIITGTATQVTIVQSTGDSSTDIMSQKAVSDEFDKYVGKTDAFTVSEKLLPDYTNQLPLAVGADGTTILNGTGYVTGSMLEMDGSVSSGDKTVTGFIRVVKGDVVRFKFDSLSSKTGSIRLALYPTLTSISTGLARDLGNIASLTTYGTVTINGDVATWDTSTINYVSWNSCQWLRVHLPTANAVITVNEEITESVQEQLSLKSTVKVARGNLDFELSDKVLSGKTVVCFGDSLFGMYRGADSTPAFVADETGATVHNVGFGGCRMASVSGLSDGFNQFGMWALAKAISEKSWTNQDTSASSGSDYFTDHLALLKSIDFNKVDIVVIHYGTNDFGAGSNPVPLDDSADPDNYSTLCGALRYSIEKLLGAYPQLRIYVSLPVYRYWTDGGTVTYAESYKRNGHTLSDYVEALRKVAIEYKLPVIDGYYGLGVNKVNASTYLADGTHHNVTGRERFGRFIGACLTSQQSAYNPDNTGLSEADVSSLINSAIGNAIGGSY